MTDYTDLIRLFNGLQHLKILCIFILIALVAYFFSPQQAFKRSPLQGVLKSRTFKLPPGPSGWPVLGSLIHFQRASRSAASLSAWPASLSEYGEVTTLKMGSKTWVYLNSSRMVDEIVSKRGNITGERPYLPVASGLISRHKRTVLHQTAQWTEGRRVMHRLLNGPALEIYGKWQEFESVHLLAASLYRPHRWYSHHFRYSISVMHQIVFDEHLLKSTPELNAFLRAGLEFIHNINFWWKPVKQAIADDEAPASFTRDELLHKSTGYAGNDKDEMYLSTSIVGGGSDNPRKVLNTFAMAELCHPNVFHMARKDIDAICGSEDQRLPSMADMANIPYVYALIKELLRWRPAVLMIPSHELTQDLDFECYHFSKGTNFLINTITVCNKCEDPEDFKPQRWLDEHVGNITNGVWQFGGGRRVCPGYKVAQQGLFVALARLIYGFDYIANGAYDSHRLNNKRFGEPFPVKMSVRSKEHEELIIKEAIHFDVLGSAKMEF